MQTQTLLPPTRTPPLSLSPIQIPVRESRPGRLHSRQSALASAVKDRTIVKIRRHAEDGTESWVDALPPPLPPGSDVVLADRVLVGGATGPPLALVPPST